jgi:trigger factor
MQVTELSAEGLKREYKITVPADEIAERVNSRLQRLQQSVRMPGFRPGKAPMPLLKKQYGRSIMGEVLEEAVDEGAKQAVQDRQLRPALRPKVEVTSFDEGKDLEFKVDLEVLPEVPEVDVAGLHLTRLVADVDEAKVDQALEGLAKARQKHEPLAEPRPSQEGDELVVDFEGKVDGQPFEGGSGKDFTLVLGSKSMVPGFEDQLVGVSAGERKEVSVTFPEAFPPNLAGKSAVFDVTVKEIRAPVPYTLDDAWAKELGEETVEGVRNRIRERLREEYAGVSRLRLKRELLDQLAERYAFPVPEGMVDIEFDSIWKQLKDEMERTGAGPEEDGKSEDELKAEYRKIAERRVRLGLLLSDIGTRNGVEVTGEELQQAVIREAMRFPGQERQALEFIRNNPGALEQIRAPVFEDKVCDLVFSKAQVEERKVPVEELLRDPDEEEAPAAEAAATAGPQAAAPAGETPAEQETPVEPAPGVATPAP